MVILMNVAVAGGTGDLGKVIVEKLLAAGDFKVRVLCRTMTDMSNGVRVIVVDYSNPIALQTALKGVDAVVCAMSGHVTEGQAQLLNAAIKAGVSRFIPSQWGGDTRSEAMAAIPLAKPKRDNAALVHEKAREGKISYTFFTGGPWIEYIMGRKMMMSVPTSTFYMHENPYLPVPMTSRAAFGDAVVGALRKSDETENRYVNIELIRLSQNQALQLAKEALPETTINIVQTSFERRYESGARKFTTGVIDDYVVADILAKCFFTEELLYTESSIANDLVGVQPISESSFKDILKDLFVSGRYESSR